MEYTPITTNKCMIFELYKPIFHSTYAIWEKWLNNAGDRKIIVKTKEGKVTFENAKEYKSKAKRIERYYKNPEVPMIFYSLSLLPEIEARKERKKQEDLKEKSIPSSIMSNPKIQEALRRIKGL